MIQLGLSAQSAPAAPAVAPAAPIPAPTNIGGFLPMASAASVLDEQKKAAEAKFQAEQTQPQIVGLANHVRKFFESARQAREPIERQMLEATYSRRGEYTASQLAEITQNGQVPIYMMLFSVKCRQAESLLRDVLIGAGSEKPWTARPTAKPDLPLNAVAEIMQGVAGEVQQAMAMGMLPTIEQIKQRLRDAREQIENQVMEEARARAERMETKMEDQLQEGGFLEALDQFITDLPQYKTAYMKGPELRQRRVLKYDDSGKLAPVTEVKPEWERVDPFNIYPAPWARDLQSAPFIERYKLTRGDLNALIGTPGFSDEAIRKVLTEYDSGSTGMWLTIDQQKASALGQDQLSATTNTGEINAFRYWGSVSGKMLREWGMKAEQVPDEAKEYEAECWLCGTVIIKAVLNPDPLGRRPYYCTSYERVPGTIWGNSMYDLMRDCQMMCNAAARALAQNMAISSGPQVVVYTDRVPSGQNVTQMYPWKIWQSTSDPMGSTAKPVDFFQPSSNAQELMGIYERFSMLADEYTGIPRYMTGTEGTPGAGRTASGLSMMIGNASKVIKAVVSGIDTYILKPLLERLFQFNMLKGDDPESYGDVNIVVRGALSLTAKESAMVRRNEFLQITANPIDMQIVGLEGRAAVLREQVGTLDMDPDRVVPPPSVIKQRAMMAQLQAMQQMQAAEQGGDKPKTGGGQQLMNGAPVTDNFQPVAA
jgi:hypothetical protein